jgi:PEGA domain
MKTGYLLLVPCLCLVSCAMLTHGGREKFTVISEPSGADVRLSSGEQGVTPATFEKARKENFTVTVTKAGYAAQTVEVSALNPNPVSVHLSRRGKSSARPAAPKTTPEGAPATPKKAPAETTPSAAPIATPTPTPASSPTPEQTTSTVTPLTTPAPETSPTP